MVMGKVRLKLCSTKRKSKERIIFDTMKLQDPCVKEAFRLEVTDCRFWQQMTQRRLKRSGDNSRRSTMRECQEGVGRKEKNEG